MFKGDILSKLVPILLVLTIALAGGVGFLGYRILKLEKTMGTPSGIPAGSPNSPTAASPLDVQTIKGYAKALGLNDKDFAKCLDEGKYQQAVKDSVSEGEKLGVNGTPTFFINGRFLGGAFPFASFKEIIDKELAGTGSNSYLSYSKDLQDQYTAGFFNPVPKKVDLGKAPAKGDPNAKVVIVDYSDFECPYCERFYSQTLSSITKEYIETGRVLFVYKQFPLITIHAHAQKAAESSLCANEQGKFWEMHDKLFGAMQTPGQ